MPFQESLPHCRLLPLFCCLLFVLSGCAARPFTPEPLSTAGIMAPEQALSERAQATLAYLLAQDLERAGDLEGAGQALQKAIQLDPTPFLSMELAFLFWRAGQTTQAKDVLKQAIVRFPRERILYTTLINAYLVENLVDQAISTMNDYLRLHPEDTSIRQDLANMLLQYARFSHAADIIQVIPEADRTPEIRLLLARSKAGLGLVRQAMDQLKLALQENPKFIEALAELASLQENQGDFVQAEKTYQRILALDQNTEEVLLRLIHLNVKLNQPDKALAYALTKPELETFLLRASLIFLREDFFEQAKALLALIPVDQGPPEADFYRALAAYDGDKDAEQALEYLGRIPEDHAHYSRALSFQGYLLLQLERTEEALNLAREGQKRFPGSNDFLLLEVEILLNEDNRSQAVILLEQAREKWPNDTEVLYRLGFIQEELGKREQALATMEEVIALEPDHAEALNFIGYILAEEGRDLERALVLIEKALELKPGSGHIIDSLAWVHYKLKNYEEAWKHIQSAVQITPDDPVIWEHYGDIAKALGKTKEARKGYLNALKFKTKHPDEVQRKLDGL